MNQSPMLRIWVKEGREWNEIPNGPFPITRAQLDTARETFAAELANTKPLHGAHHAPQTATRDILRKLMPNLSPFDALMLGFAVSNPSIKTAPFEA